MYLLHRVVCCVYAISHFLKKVLFQQFDCSVVDMHHIFTLNLNKGNHPVRILNMYVQFVSRRVTHKPRTDHHKYQCVDYHPSVFSICLFDYHLNSSQIYIQLINSKDQRVG